MSKCRLIALMRMRKAVFMALACVCLAACGNTGALKGSTVKGTRISILEQTKGIQAEKELQNTKPELAPVIDNAAWPQAGYDTAHLEPNAQIPEHLKEAWRANIGEGSNSDYKLLARPVVSHGVIYTMDSRGSISAFRTKDGDQIWNMDTAPEKHEDDAIGGGLGVNGDALFATTGFGEVLAIDTKNGKIKWRHHLLQPVRAAPTIADGRVFAVSIDNQLTVLNADSGEEIWHHNGIAENAALMGAASPAVVSDSVVVAYSSGEIYNLRAENGRVSWNYALGATQTGSLPASADIRGLPIVDHGQVFAVSHSGQTAAIDQRTGDRDWEADVGGVNTAVVSGDTVFLLSNDDQLVALTRQGGRILWVHKLQTLEDPSDTTSDHFSWTGPVMAGNKLWLTNSIGHLVSFAPANGDQIDVIDIGDPSSITPIIADGTIYVITDNGELVALR